MALAAWRMARLIIAIHRFRWLPRAAEPAQKRQIAPICTVSGLLEHRPTAAHNGGSARVLRDTPRRSA